jgi:arylsulfatase A-like enzyme
LEGIVMSHASLHKLKNSSWLAAVAWALCIPGLVVAQSAARAAAPPNILFIISDDVGVDVSTGMYPGLVDQVARQYGPRGLKHPGAAAIKGHPASTPNLDRLARRGVAFSNVWAQPFCSPTRASILTGLFASKANVLNYADPLSQNYASFVQRLKDEAGYRTGLFGKWHLAGVPGRDANYPGMKPKEAGFEIFKGNMHAALKTYWDYDYMEQDAATPANQWRTGKPPQRSLPGIAPTTLSGVVQVADALEWITAQEQASPGKPWFAWVAFNLAHATAQVQPSQMMVPNIDTLDAASRQEMEACSGTFGTHQTGKCSGEALQRAMTNSMDTLVGKLLAGVDRLDRNTVVIYIGDNGTPMYGRPQLDFIDNLYITRKGRGKGTVYESGARVPLAIRGPGIVANRVNGEYVHAADLFPTILGLAGLKSPQQVPTGDGKGTQAVDGQSLAPILAGKAKTVRDPNQGYLLTESLNLMTNSTRQVAARNGTYKVICTEKVEPAACEFYNLIADPLEEFPLDEPASCAGSWTARDPQWHYCRLSNLIRTESFFAKGR